MKITKKDLIEDRKDGDNDLGCSPCCSVKDSENERKFYMSVPCTVEAMKGLKLGESVKVVVEGKLCEARSRWGAELEIEVGTLEMTSGKSELEELLDEED